VNLADPEWESSALIVTFCGVLKLLGVNFSDFPSSTISPGFPEVREVVTVTLLDGAAGSEIPTVLVLPCWTFSDLGLAIRLLIVVVARPRGTVAAPAAAPAMVTSATSIVGQGVPQVGSR